MSHELEALTEMSRGKRVAMDCSMWGYHIISQKMSALEEVAKAIKLDYMIDRTGHMMKAVHGNGFIHLIGNKAEVRGYHYDLAVGDVFNNSINERIRK